MVVRESFFVTRSCLTKSNILLGIPIHRPRSTRIICYVDSRLGRLYCQCGLIVPSNMDSYKIPLWSRLATSFWAGLLIRRWRGPSQCMRRRPSYQSSGKPSFIDIEAWKDWLSFLSYEISCPKRKKEKARRIQFVRSCCSTSLHSPLHVPLRTIPI